VDQAEEFSDFYRAHFDEVMRYALRRTDPETAKDVVAETFLVAWRRLDAVPTDSGMASPWLYGVARRVLANTTRARLRAERLTARLGQDRRVTSAADAAGEIAETDRLRHALATLSELDQEALRLVGWEELDLAAAALAMGCSRATMAVRLHRARRRLEQARNDRTGTGRRPERCAARDQSGDTMNYQHDTIEQVRSIMAPANPVPGDAAADSAAGGESLETLNWVLAQGPEPADRARQPRRPAENRRSWRVIAPVAAAVAVAALVAGLTVVGQSPKAHVRPSATGAPTDGQGMPEYYVTLSQLTQTMSAVVHDAATGQVLSQIGVPGERGVAPNIVADGSDRSYILTGTVVHPTLHLWKEGKAEPEFYRLRVAADGRSETLTRLPVNVQPMSDRNAVLTGMALSPGGSQLALAVETNAPSNLRGRGEIALYSLTGGAARTWTAPGDQGAFPMDPNWISKSQLAFVWQDHLTGSGAYFFTGRSQIRVLDTSAPGQDLLASRVLLTGGGRLGFIQTAAVGPGGSPITVATFRVTSVGGRGTATMLLAQVAPNGAVQKTFVTYTSSYSGLPQE